MKNQQEQPTSKYIETGSIKSHYADWGGTGQSVLLVHGNMRTSRSFDAVARGLRDTSNVLAMDLIGHGNSTWTDSGYKFSDRTDDVNNFIVNKDLRGLCAVGHSLGGAAVAMSAMNAPERFDQLVLLEPMMEVNKASLEKNASRPQRPRRTYKNLEELRELLQTHKVTKNWTHEVIEDVVAHETFLNHENRIDIKWSPATLSSPEKLTDELDLEPALRQISIPTLIVVSENGEDEFEMAFSLGKELDHIQTIVMSDTGHNMYMERPEALAKIVSDFINSLPLPNTI